MAAEPIRVGIIGLSAQGSWAAAAHLPYLQASPRYAITALCNSSEASARAAIARYGLPAGTRAHGSYQALADDEAVDLVLCSVNVVAHRAALEPAIRAGKAVYSEWPLGRDLDEARELHRLARHHGVATVVGLQGPQSPVVSTLRRAIAQGRIGRVLSCSFSGAAGYCGPEDWEHQEYFAKTDVGGNLVSILFGHSIETVTAVLGELASFNSLLDVQVPQVELTDKMPTDPTRRRLRTVARETHDQVLVQGRFASGALLSYHLYGGKAVPAPGEGLHWRILGERGELVVTGAGTALQMGYADLRVRLYDNRTDAVEELPLLRDAWDDSLPLPAPNVARVYEAFADRRTADYPDWDHALRRHRLIDEMYARERAGVQVQKATYLEE